MSIFSRFFSYFSDNANSDREGAQLITPTVTAHEDAPALGLDSALQVSTVWACVSLMVDNLSSLPLEVYLETNQGKQQPDRMDMLNQVMHYSPNRRQTSKEFWSTMLVNYFMRGNAYARLDRNARGEVVAMWPLSANQMEVVVASDGSIVYVYTVDNNGIVYLEKDILHLKGMGNGIIGLSPLDYMTSSISLAISSQNHMTKTYRKNARRPGMLMVDGVLTDEQRQAVRNNFGDIVEGNKKELFVLEAKFKFEPLGMTPADLQLDQTRNYSVEDICRWLGVPSVLVNDTKQTTSLGSSVQQIIEVFYRLNLRPKLEGIEQSLYRWVLTPQQRAKGYMVEFNLDSLLRANAMERADIHAKQVQNGLRTRNEIRKGDNLETLPGGDILTVQSNLFPIEQLGQQTAGQKMAPEETIRQ